MFSSHFFSSDVSGKAAPIGTPGMGFHGWRFASPGLRECCDPFLNARGKAAYWLIAALFLLVIFSGMVVLYRAGHIWDKEFQPVIALDRKEVHKLPQKYKIASPPKESVGSSPISPSDKVVSEAPADPSDVTSKKRMDSVRLASPARTPEGQEALPQSETEKPSVMEAKKGEAILTRKHSDTTPSADKKARPEGVSQPQVAAGTEKEASREMEGVVPRTEGGVGKRFFVRAYVSNIREAPSMTSGIKFRVERGVSVTVTDKRGGWYAVRLDDGRFGWAYHTLLSDSFVPQRDATLAIKEIKAIRTEAVAGHMGKVVFELNGPDPPRTIFIEEEKPRIVCDFLDAYLGPDIRNTIEVNNGIIEKIRIGRHNWPKLMVRVVLDLVPKRNYKIEKSLLEKENLFVLEIKAE
ncbi:MAG: AMIN domain-containing protein [Desulfobacterales bacterium]|nr:AMIN domain-containing protein [Desulfobacterales bacterium]